MYVELHPEADEEFTGHALFYERREPGLGYHFIDEIERGIELGVSQPQIGPQLDEEFGIESDRIWVVAVAHQRRRPGYWRERVDR